MDTNKLWELCDLFIAKSRQAQERADQTDSKEQMKEWLAVSATWLVAMNELRVAIIEATGEERDIP